MRANPRLQVGSASWISEERSSALQLIDAEAEEFSFSARNDVDWLNEHMAEIFSKNQVQVNKLPLSGSANAMITETLPKSSKHQASYAERHLERLERSILWRRAQ